MSLNVLGLGLASSLGCDVDSACAAHRAGLSRPSELNYFRTLDMEEGVEKGVVGFAATGVTEGFLQIGRWIQLALTALDNLLKGTGIGRESPIWKETGLVLILPTIDDRYQATEIPDNDFFIDNYLERVLEQCGIAIDRGNQVVVSRGHASAAYAFIECENILNKSSLSQVLIVSADSYLDPTVLEWLSDSDRLKIDEMPNGLVPGEAGAAVLVGYKSRLESLATISAYSVAEARSDDFLEEKLQGSALSDALNSVISNHSKPFSGTLISDLNGEAWRTSELYIALSKLSPDTMSNDRAVETVADSFGDTGSVSGFISLAVAIASLRRGYAASNHILVSNSSEGREVGCYIVSNGKKGIE